MTLKTYQAPEQYPIWSEARFKNETDRRFVIEIDNKCRVPTKSGMLDADIIVAGYAVSYHPGDYDDHVLSAEDCEFVAWQLDAPDGECRYMIFERGVSGPLDWIAQALWARTSDRMFAHEVYHDFHEYYPELFRDPDAEHRTYPEF